MTLKEAKKILEKEFVEIGFHKSTEPFEFDESRCFVGEKPEVLDAFRVLSKEGYYITISGHDYDMRKARLGRPTDKPSSDTPSTLNPALKEAASQFNDALLDEQAKKIAELTKDKELMKKATLSQLDDFIEIYNLLTKESQKAKRLGKEIARLNNIIHKKNLKIEELKKERSEHLAGEVKFFGETVDLSQELCDKNEELRLSKIREKNLTEVCQKKVKEIEELRKELADKVVDKIDAQALKSAESALAWKEKVVTYKDMALAYYEKKITEKDEVIADLGKELEATKNELEEKNYLIDMLRNSSREYCDYGIAIGKENKKPRIPTPEEPKHDKIFEDFVNRTIDNYNRRAANFGWIGSKDGNGIIGQMVGADFAEEGGDQSATIVQCDNGITLSKEEAEIIERCTKNGTELHYSEKDGLTYTNVFGEEMPISCLRGMFHVFTDEEIRNLKK